MLGPLRSVWNAAPASPAPPKRVWRDWVLVAVLPLVALFEGLVRTDLPFAAASVGVVIAIVPTLLWRRTHPLLMFLISFGMTSAFRLFTGEELQLYTQVFLLLLVYAVFRWGSGRALAIGAVVMLVTTTASTVFAPFDLASVIGSFAIVLFTVSLGLLLRYRAAFRVRELDRAKSNEREELARDLHDTVAHHVSAIAIQAQAGLATVGTNPDAATAALRVIEAEASRTLTEMRAMVRLLRRDDDLDLAPAPKVAELEALAGGGQGGPVIDVELTGDTDSLPAPIATAVVRIVQEAVTNARRHARSATRIDVRVDADGDRARLTVHDDGAPGPAGTGHGTGYGIVGMTERATLLGGTCTAGRVADGWTVTADLPRTGVAR